MKICSAVFTGRMKTERREQHGSKWDMNICLLELQPNSLPHEPYPQRRVYKKLCWNIFEITSHEEKLLAAAQTRICIEVQFFPIPGCPIKIVEVDRNVTPWHQQLVFSETNWTLFKLFSSHDSWFFVISIPNLYISYVIAGIKFEQNVRNVH